MKGKKHIQSFNDHQEKLNIFESKKSPKKEITAEKMMKDFMRDTGLTKEEALKKLKEFSKELDQIEKNSKIQK
jgi:hypothetical protein